MEPCLRSLDAASIGFIIVIDRRKDKWSSVKASLSRIAVRKAPTCESMNAMSLFPVVPFTILSKSLLPLFLHVWLRKFHRCKTGQHVGVCAYSASLLVSRGRFRGTCSWCWC